MTIIETFIRLIGEECLIIKFKSSLYYNLIDFDINDYTSCFNQLKNKPISTYSKNNFKQSNINLLFVIIYNLYGSSNQDAINYFDINLRSPKTKSDLDRKEHLFCIFNQIEFDMKYKIYSKEEYKLFLIALNTFVNYSKQRDVELLYQYYLAYVNLILLNDRDTDKYYINVILDITDCDEGEKPFSFIKYMNIRNSLIGIEKLELFEQQNNKNELIQNVESLMNMVNSDQKELAVKLGLKLYTIQEKLGDYNKCIQTLEKLLIIINQEKLFGKNQRSLIELLIYIYGLLGYYNSLLGKFEEVKRFTKKLDKMLILLESSSSKKLKENNESVIAEYSLYTVILEKISDSKMKNSESIKNSINSYKKHYSINLKNQDDVIMNIYFLDENNQTNYKSFTEKYLKYETILRNDSYISDDNLFSFYLYLFNMLGLLQRYKTEESNLQIRNKSKMILQYTSKLLISQQRKKIMELFQLPFFKDIFLKIFFSYISTFYHSKEYNIIIYECNDFFPLFYQFGLDDINCSSIHKLKGDALYKLQQYNEAYKSYEEASNHDEKNATIWFNMALCKLMNGGNKQKIINLLKKAESFSGNNKEKLKLISSLQNEVNFM